MPIPREVFNDVDIMLTWFVNEYAQLVNPSYLSNKRLQNYGVLSAGPSSVTMFWVTDTRPVREDTWHPLKLNFDTAEEAARAYFNHWGLTLEFALWLHNTPEGNDDER